MNFVHLHVHTEYSLLDGAARIPDLIAKTKELGMDAVAITDHGVMFGVIDFYKEAKRQGIKPIIGCEVYTAARTMADKDPEKDKYQGHLVLLAKNQQGYQNLMKIVSLGFTKGFYYKPRIDREVLLQYNEGIICLSACLAGNIQRRLMNDDYNGAKEEALFLSKTFGKGNFYLEVQDQGLEDEAKILPGIKQLSEELGLPLVATNDVHYVNRSDAMAHDVLLCIQTVRSIYDDDRMRFPNDQFYLKPPQEMEDLFAGMEDALSNTVKIAEECNVEFEFGNIHLPEFTPPEGRTNEEYLRELCINGFEQRYGGGRELGGDVTESADGIENPALVARESADGTENPTLVARESAEGIENTALVAKKSAEGTENPTLVARESAEGIENLALVARESAEGIENLALVATKPAEGTESRKLSVNELLNRLEYELSVISEMGYVEYFLVVWDFINYARTNGIMVGPGRGSAAGSIVAYCLKITDVDPIKYGLIFERFLNPERISMPDIDIDFCYERRQEVIDYVVEKYGSEKVAQIITFGTMKAKAAIRDVGRALAMTYNDVDVIAKKVPFDLKMTVKKAIDINADLRSDYETNEQIKQLLDMAIAIEGMPRHASTHAAGVVISKKDIDEYVPLYVQDKGITTQFTMNTIEELGLLKMDFLGLRNLTVIQDTLNMINDNHGISIDFHGMEYDDKAVYELISSGNTLGVFQLESTGMRQFMKNLKPDCFEDIIAGVALYRPGPMDSIPTYIANKKDPSLIKYVDDRLSATLDVTYGCMVYQEQVMQIVRDMAGYTYGRSDLVRRAMGKKKLDVMKKEEDIFINGQTDEHGNIIVQGCIRKGISRQAAKAVFDQMVKFAEYAFNKSHAAAYAVLAYQTAYLKTYYSVEFMASLMSSVMGDANQMAKYIRNCKEMGITVLPPDVNRSYRKFTVEDGKIRFGLLGVKNVGTGVIDEIIRVREERGQPTTIFDFIGRLNIHELNKKALESLIRAGALECLSGSRAQHLACYERLTENAQNMARKNIEGQMSLFQMEDESAPMVVIEEKLPQVGDFTSQILMSMEKEILGIYLSGHPLDDYIDQIHNVITANSEELSHASESGQFTDGMMITVAGIISSQKRMTTKNNKMMSFLQLEDLYGTIEVIVFPNIFERNITLLSDESIIAVRGRINFKEDEAPKLIAERIAPVERDASVRFDKNVLNLRLEAGCNEKMVLQEIGEILKSEPGKTHVVIFSEASGKRFKADSSLWTSASQAVIDSLTSLLGAKNVKY